jgi:glycosyltransferase involved in cell wall biosynthesis
VKPERGIDVSVVLPVYRNAETLVELHSRLATVLEGCGLEFEVLCVDDACPLGSLDVLRTVARSDPRVAVVSLARNAGQHRAVLAGLSLARGQRAVVLDADLQDPPEAIPELLAKLEEGYGAVFAGRRGRYESAGRLLTSRLFKRLLSRLCGAGAGMADAGLYVVLDRPMISRVLSMENGAPFVVAMIGCAGLPLASVPVVRSPRPSGESAYSSWRRLKSGLRAVAWVIRWRVGRRRTPDAAPAIVGARIGERFRALEPATAWEVRSAS